MFYFVKEISLTECCDWSVGECLHTSNEVSVILFTSGFRKFISNVNVLIIKRKILKVLL